MHADWMEQIYVRNVRARMEEVMEESREYEMALLEERTADMANLLYREYQEIKNEAILATFGYDVDRNVFVGGSPHDIIGQALQMKAERMDQGLPINRMFDD